MNTVCLYPLKCYIKIFPEDRERIKIKKKPFEEETIVCNISKDFTYYYSWFIKRKLGITLETPPFGGHITIHNGIEQIPDLKKHMDYLRSLEGKAITVEYDPTIYLHWRFFAVEVFSKELDEIRKTLGLPKKSYHITIGKIKDINVVPKSSADLIIRKQACVEVSYQHVKRIH